MNVSLEELDEKRKKFTKEYSTLVEKAGALYKEWNQLHDNFFRRIFQHNKLKQLEAEIKRVLEQQEDNFFESKMVEQDIESLKAEEKLNANIHAATESLFEKGLYLSEKIYSPEKIRSADFVKIEIDECAEKTYNHIPSVLEIINFAEDHGLITKIDSTEKRKLYRELNKIDFGVDEEPYSYANVVYSLFERNNEPFVYVYDDRDMPYEILTYDSFEDKWKGEGYPFVVDNPCDSILLKYSGDTLTTTDKLEGIYSELDLNINLTEFTNELEKDLLRLSEGFNNNEATNEIVWSILEKMNPIQIDYLTNKYNEMNLNLEIDANAMSIEENKALEEYFESQLQSTISFIEDAETAYTRNEELGDVLTDVKHQLVINIEKMSKEERKKADMIFMGLPEEECYAAIKCMDEVEKQIEITHEDGRNMQYNSQLDFEQDI
ncbi:hypothetical protein AF435_04460 [Listeria monocytogenes]|uniref:Uncharacterized protein n=1 Tax=Listeria monocytogenes TaxID=1639 RepID=A0AAN2WHB7_LISMN|nr:hypothetical protein [Listeria monocytogenes]EAC3367743.1 hypothetical protein [Listeria monocytogenes]EAC7084972.1 hypothetical protein [Listeria monocytogenes]EAC8541998.1 hypothetical protein [Listeria monocytogenes]EAC8547999.1 hypothetical protein [Listeria monocytogenes]